MLVVEAASTLNLENGNDCGIFVDCSLLDDVAAGIWPGVMDVDSPNVGTCDKKQ